MREEQNLKTVQAVNSDPVELHVGPKEIWLAKMKNSKDFWKANQTMDIIVFITIFRLARSAFLR